MVVKDQNSLTSHDLHNILEVNKKAIEIHIEVEKQQDEIIESQSTILQVVKDNNNKINSIDKYLFKLTLVLGTVTVATIVELVRLLLLIK